MLYRSLLAGLALAVVATDSEAGPFRRSARSAYIPAYQPVYQPAYQPVYQPAHQPAYLSPAFTPGMVTPAGAITSGTTPVVMASAEHLSGYGSVVPSAVTLASFPGMGVGPVGGFDGDGLAEVNALRAARGLRPFLRDEGLSQAARACAQFRAANGLTGHTSNDFAFVPAGTFASSAGCAAAPAGFGWMSCCVYENYTYAGAAWVTGRDGRRYMHLFVR
jgi:hypothetical protein